MRAIRELTLVLGLLASGSVAAAGLGGGLKANNNPGIGLEVSSGVLEPFGRRAWITAMRHDVEEAGVRYDDSFRYGTGFLLADWHPGGTGFRLSGGLAYNQQRTDITGRQSGATIGIGSSYPGAAFKTFEDRTRYARPSPYLGLGWGIAPTRKSGLYFSADLGVMYQRPGASFIGSCTALTPGACGLSDLREETEHRNGVDDFRFFPVVSFGVGLRF
jgi:hypothetical protein